MSEQSSLSSDGQRAGFASQPGSSARPNPLDPAERLAELHLELNERLEDERSAQVLLFQASGMKNRATARVHQTTAAIALLEKKLGVVPEVWPDPRDDEPLGDPGALGRFGGLVHVRARR